MKNKTLTQDIILWEKNRVVFNVVMFVSGIVIFFIVNSIKPIDPHKYGQFYLDLMFSYAIFANLVYTAAYTYVLRLFYKFNFEEDKKSSIRKFTRKFILFSGLASNIFAGILEATYRLLFMK